MGAECFKDCAGLALYTRPIRWHPGKIDGNHPCHIPIGRLITIWAKEGAIIGVVKNFHSSSFHEKIKPIVFMLSERHGPRTKIFVKLKTHDISETIQYIKGKAVHFAPNNQFEYTFLDEVFADQYSRDQRLGALYRIFTILAVIISCLGLYGLVSLATY